jgi:Arc/MetJ-type ribon-helix-helix transcriptional regulator
MKDKISVTVSEETANKILAYLARSSYRSKSELMEAALRRLLR